VYPTLYHFVFEMFGVKLGFLKFVNTFGIVVVIGFGVAAAILASECQRLERLGVLQPTFRSSVRKKRSILTLLKRGRSVANGPVKISWRHHAGEAGFVAAWSGFAGAKVLYLMEHPSSFAKPTLAGFSMYGGLIFAGAMVMRYFIRNGITFWPAVDSAALGVFVAYAIGRLGCHFSGDGDWGIVNTSPKPGFLPHWLWAYDYPNNVAHLGVPLKSGTCFPSYCTQLRPAVFPTSVYEFFLVMALVGVLWAMRTRLKTPGVLFGWFLILDGLERVAIDQIRVHAPWVGPLTQVEIIGTLLIVSGAIVAWYLPRRNLAIPRRTV
jgi:prolipoprotein diacylglyceryltransferase